MGLGLECTLGEENNKRKIKDKREILAAQNGKTIKKKLNFLQNFVAFNFFDPKDPH